MTKRTTGDVLEAEAEALVCSVNCAGVMKRGLSKQVRERFPENYRQYRAACARGEVRLGGVFTVDLQRLFDNPRYIINLPTVGHWRDKAQPADVRAGIAALAEEVQRLGVQSVAVPPVGCGWGGLRWAQVSGWVEGAFAGHPEVRVLLVEPAED